MNMFPGRYGLRHVAVAVSLALSAASGIAAAAETVVVWDDFEDGTRFKTPSGIDWFTLSHVPAVLPMSVVDDTAGIGTGKALLVDTKTTQQTVMGGFGAPIALPETLGAKLTLRFEMRNQSAEIVGGTVRFGLYDADEEVFPDPAGFGGLDGDYDQSQPGSYFDPGVFVQLDNDVRLTCCPPSATRLREEPNSFFPGFGNTLFGVDDRNLAQPPAGEVFPGMAQGSQKTKFKLELERVAPGNATYAWNVTYTIDDGTKVASLTGPHLGPEYFAANITNNGVYDYFALFYGGEGVSELGGADFLVDNFSISVTTPGQALPGDFNNDSKVDGADLLLWQQGGSPSPLSASDLSAWEANFGAAGSSVAGSPVPEASSFVLAVLGLAACARRRRCAGQGCSRTLATTLRKEAQA